VAIGEMASVPGDECRRRRRRRRNVGYNEGHNSRG